MLTLSIVIPVHNGGAILKKCLENATQTHPLPDEIILVADGCTDNSVEIAREFGVKVLVHSESLGPAAARNRGARAAKGDVVLFLDSDVAVPSDIVERVLEVFTRETDVTAIIGSYDNSPEASNFLSQYKNLFHHYIHQTSQEDASTFWGAFGAIRREAFQRVCGFDPRYKTPSVEDIELGFRLKRAGYRIRLCKNLQVRHLKRWEAWSFLKTELFRRAIPWTDLILRNRQWTFDLNTRPADVVSVFAAYGLLGSLLGVIWFPGFIIPGSLFAACLLWINMPVYRFFKNRRGYPFALRTAPWIWLYYLYSGFGFAVGSAKFLWKYGVLSIANVKSERVSPS
jgi:GT2 family glycosyltransferase